MEFSKATLSRAPWSYSMANLAHNCPFAFHRKYVLRERPTAPERIEGKIGSIVHSILEWCVMGMTVDQAFEKSLEVYDMLYEVEIAVQNFRVPVTEFIKGLERWKKAHNVVQVFPEKKLGLTKDFKTTDYRNKKGDCLIRGIIDLTLLTGNKRAVIIDHKTGAKKTLDTYDHQVGVYSLMVDALASGLRGVRTAIHYVGANRNRKGSRTEWQPEYPVEVVRSRFREDITQWLNKAAESAESTTDPKSGWMCGWCGYQPVCPLKK